MPNSNNIVRQNKPRPFSGFTILIAATAVAGIAGYLVTWLVYRTLGPSNYTNFAVYWSALFLVVGGLSGVQQELARASAPVTTSTGSRLGSAPRFAIGLAAVVTVVVAASSPFWGIPFFGSDFNAYTFPLILGAAAYVIVAVVSGSLYGLSLWFILGSMITVDALLRVFLVALVCVSFPQSNLIAWAVAAPFVLTPLLLSVILKNSLLHKVRIDVGLKKLSWNSMRTVSASLLTAILVSGFPLALGVTSPKTPKDLLGELIFTITLTRAPLIVLVSSLQSLFIVRFRDNPSQRTQLLKQMIVGVFGIAVLLSVPAGFFGLQFFEILTGHTMQVDSWFISMLVISSGLVAILSITGAALLATSHHSAYVIGWTVAAIFTVITLSMGVNDYVRIELALIVAPLLGVITHLAFWFLIEKKDSNR